MTQPSYEELCRDFEWADVLRDLGWTGDADVNPATTIVDRHAEGDKVALHWFGKDGTRADVTYRELSRQSARFANLLVSLGVRPGDRVLGVLPRVPETLAVMLGVMKAGAIYVPVFTGFAADAIQYRATHSEARVVVLHHEFRGRAPARIEGADAIVTIDGPSCTGIVPGDIGYAEAMAGQADEFAPVPRRRDDAALMLYTSGSTGQPKAVRIANNFLAAIWPYVRYGIDLRADDRFWPTGDPGWGYGFVCYMVPLAMGVAVHALEATPTPEATLDFLEAEGITNMATVPTLLRGVMALGADAVSQRRVRVRRLNCCGEPLNAEVVSFFQRTWDVTPQDQYGSSEQGMPMGNLNAADMPVKPGSMGRPMPGQTMAIVDDDGRPLPAGTIGHVGLMPSSQGYYALGYWNNPAAMRTFRRGEWIVAGDLGRMDEDGYFWFEGRADDVIKSAGYRIGPFEVESAILQHGDVAEAAVVGKPDPRRGQIVKAFVVLKPGRAVRPGLDAEIVAVVKDSLGRHQQPREIEFVDALPTTVSGKIQRFKLRQDAT